MEISKKLFVYEITLSKSEYKKLVRKKLVSGKEWESFCETLSDELDLTFEKVVENATVENYQMSVVSSSLYL
jgi:hypothetical protein